MARKIKDPNAWTKEEIKEKLLTDDHWLCRGMVAIYNLQTADEKATQTTKEDNGVGFSGVDAFILSKFVEDYKKWGRLTPKQIKCARSKMPKYAGQLARISKPKGVRP